MSGYYNLVKTDPLQFYLHNVLGGYKFRLNGDMLEVNPMFAIDSEMAMLIKQHKSDLIKLISRHQLI